jgi:hypothetical protein
MSSARDRLIGLARAHAAAEARGDVAATLATLEPDPVYELFPVGRSFRGMAETRAYYAHFFAEFLPRVAGHRLRSEWVSDEGVGQEYEIELRAGDGRTQRHRVIGILTFGREALSGERVWASEPLLRRMFGPVYDRAEPV